MLQKISKFNANFKLFKLVRIKWIILRWIIETLFDWKFRSNDAQFNQCIVVSTKVRYYVNTNSLFVDSAITRFEQPQFVASFVLKYPLIYLVACVVVYVLKTFCSLVDSSVPTSVDPIEIFSDPKRRRVYTRWRNSR